MGKAEYDFLTFTSFLSSAKISTEKDEIVQWLHPTPQLPVTPGAKLRVEVKAKREGLATWPNISYVWVSGWNGKEWVGIKVWPHLPLPYGSFDWQTFSNEVTIPSDVATIQASPAGGKGITWFDDLRVYQDGVLIYSDDFSNWSPVIGAGVGAPIGGVAGYLLKEPLGPMVSEVVGAVIGGVVGGGVGLLTGLGIIPVPQIPSLGAAPEGPGAPARLGKYQITG